MILTKAYKSTLFDRRVVFKMLKPGAKKRLIPFGPQIWFMSVNDMFPTH